MILFLLISGLLLLGVSLIVLHHCIEQAVDGHEDSLGFHHKSHDWTREGTSFSPAEVKRWDQVEGANCPLKMSSSFQPMGNPPLNSQGP